MFMHPKHMPEISGFLFDLRFASDEAAQPEETKPLSAFA